MKKLLVCVICLFLTGCATTLDKQFDKIKPEDFETRGFVVGKINIKEDSYFNQVLEHNGFLYTKAIPRVNNNEETELKKKTLSSQTMLQDYFLWTLDPGTYCLDENELTLSGGAASGFRIYLFPRVLCDVTVKQGEIVYLGDIQYYIKKSYFIKTKEGHSVRCLNYDSPLGAVFWSTNKLLDDKLGNCVAVDRLVANSVDSIREILARKYPELSDNITVKLVEEYIIPEEE